MSGERDARLRLMTNPAVENALSDGTEVAGMHKYFRARVANFGKRELLSRQKSRMSALGVSGVSDRYTANSS